MPQTPPSLNSVVTKHNHLLPKLAKMELSELRLLTFCLAHYDSRPDHRADDETPDGFPIPQEFFRFTATVQDLLDIFPGMDKKSAYAVVRKAVKGINSKPFEETFVLPSGKTEDVLFYWFSGFRYSNDEGRFTFMLSPDIVDMVLSQDSNFTRFRLKHVYQFKSALTWKLYELLKQWAVAGRWAVDLDELRMSLGIPGKYPTWRDLKKRVLDNPIKEINELSDITVKYEKKKRVRAVTGVVFFISSKERNDDSLVAVIGDENNDMQRLMHHGVSQHQAEIVSRLAKEAGRDLGPSLEKILVRYESKSPEERGIKAAYIFSALKDEFTPTLFDKICEDKSVKKISAYQQKKESNENTKYFKEAVSCKYYPYREQGENCQAIKARTSKCKMCNRILKK